MQVTPISKTLEEVFRGNFLRIPRFQRPYSWDRENLSDFWLDLVQRTDDEYFMGSIVMFRDGKERNVYYLVDGQQRLTTIAITLAIIRDEFDELAEKDLGEGTHNLIESKDLDNKSRFVLEHDPANKYLQARIQKREPDKGAAPASPEERALRDARAYLVQMLSDHLSAATLRGASRARADQRRSALVKLRNRLLALQFISIELTNDDDAYLIFETLNTRGKDLQISDLLKNLFTRLIKPATKGMDVAKGTWNDVLKRFASVSTFIDPDTFVQHYWLATHEYVSKARLFKEMKTAIAQAQAQSYLKDISAAADVYADIVAPLEARWKKEERELRDSLHALSIFRVAQALPLVLSMIRLYREGVIALAQTKRAISVIEKFTFQFNAIAESRGGGGVAAMYAKLAQRVHACETAQDFSHALKEIKGKLEDRIPSSEEFDVGFTRIRYTSDFTRDRALVRYILRKFSERFGLAAEIDGALYTTEHIRAEALAGADADSVGSLGNLIYVPERVNQDLKTKSFAQKLSILKAKQVPMDPWLEEATKWTSREIEARTRELSRVAYSEIWRI